MLKLTPTTDVHISCPDSPVNRILAFEISAEAKERVVPYLSALVANGGVEFNEDPDGSFNLKLFHTYDIYQVTQEIANGIREEFALRVEVSTRKIYTNVPA